MKELIKSEDRSMVGQLDSLLACILPDADRDIGSMPPQFQQAVLDVELITGFRFQRKMLLLQALVDPSMVNGVAFLLAHNKRLEYLGDIVLNLVVSELLLADPDNDPYVGSLDSCKIALISGKMLAAIAHELQLDKSIINKTPLYEACESERNRVMENALEAIIGALYADQGLLAAREFVELYVMPKLVEVKRLGLHINPKSQLQHHVQLRYGVNVTYTLLTCKQIPPNWEFTSGVYVEHREIGRGSGSSIKQSEFEAAKNAMKRHFAAHV